MDRRDFLRVGLAASLIGVTGARSGRSVASDATDETLWLNWNENPLGLAPGARQAAAEALSRAHRYPDLERAALATELAAHHGLEPDHVVLGCGSTQVLRAVVAAHALSHPRLIMAEPTFEAVARYQQSFAATVERVPLDDRFAHDIQEMRRRASDGPAVVYLCNPNNPTGTLTPSAEIDAWIREAPPSIVFVVDEAYFEYVEDGRYRTAAGWVSTRSNVVVTRTFSKIYAMAGLRLGYGLAAPPTARRLRAFMAADNVNGVVVAAARAALADSRLIPESRRVNAESREIVSACLQELDLRVLPSHTNFVMHRVNTDLETYIALMRDRGIRVGRPFPPLREYNRLSLGSPHEMRRWAATLRELRADGLA